MQWNDKLLQWFWEIAKQIFIIIVYTILCYLILRLHWIEHRGKLYGLDKKSGSNTTECQYLKYFYLFFSYYNETNIAIKMNIFK